MLFRNFYIRIQFYYFENMFRDCY